MHAKQSESFEGHDELLSASYSDQITSSPCFASIKDFQNNAKTKQTKMQEKIYIKKNIKASIRALEFFLPSQSSGAWYQFHILAWIHH
ncbi:hypothetical protein KFK09_015365 [Dendrobium nobile]|uniref:Uncharacterized protein n=1 Tax=Dendrobium nobile TaxID=94219 RepID=A0A8T3B714_DENNO|nr:hypothetical protein KFK09_015365 [Dendrobium nobile]